MRAVVCREYGPPESLKVEELPDPVLGEGQALVDVKAAAVNFPDLLIIENRYQVPASVPFVPGSEFAGIVSAVAPGVEKVAVGDRVAGSTFVGAFAEKVAVPAASLTHLPDGFDFRVAAGFGVAYATSYYALRSAARLAAGETLLVLGAAGGVGLAAVDLGRLMGARVIAAASSEEKLAACRELGAADTVDYARQNLKERVKELTGGKGANVVIDPVGGPYSEAALRSTAWGGRYVVVGFAAGEIPRFPLNVVLLKGCQVIGFTIGGLMVNAPQEAERGRRELLDLLFSGAIRPRVSAVYGLDATARAMRDLAERRAIGKVIIEP
jgi:NADPH2:quinone reductase